MSERSLPVIIPRAEHPVSRKQIDPDALRVLYRLHQSGYESFVVGGAVRDLLRGRTPKDFDVATNATPNQIRREFRNSRIIGRRFRLVHVFFGAKNVEVATLRRAVTVDPHADGPSAEDAFAPEAAAQDLDEYDENCWGTVETDAWRRDFTINALFYNIADFSLVDHVGGVEDLRQGLIRCIGEPALRFKEDPVRMLRAIKFAARFSFTIEAQTDKGMREHAAEIHTASRFRVTEELFRIVSQKRRHQGLRLLREYGFLQLLWPTWLEAVGEDGFEQVCDLLERIDHHADQGRFLPLESIAAALFLPLLDHVDPHEGQYHEHVERLDEELSRLADEMDMPRRLASLVGIILRGQLYLLYFTGRSKQVQKFVRRPEFDWIWRLADLAFGDDPRLHGVLEFWLATREAIGHEIGGWCEGPDARDVFSFRGITGGGRREPGAPAGTIKTGPAMAVHLHADEPNHGLGAHHHHHRRRRRRR